MPNQLKPLQGDSFTQFLRDSAANSRSWPEWVRGEERSTTSTLRTGGQDQNAEKVTETPKLEKDHDC
jgi:hypothetical protein